VWRIHGVFLRERRGRSKQEKGELLRVDYPAQDKLGGRAAPKKVGRNEKKAWEPKKLKGEWEKVRGYLFVVWLFWLEFFQVLKQELIGSKRAEKFLVPMSGEQRGNGIT